MDVSVIVPRAGNCPYRQRAWEWVSAQYDLEVVEGHGNADAWCKADAVHDALARATGDLLVIADADVWADNLAESITRVEQGAPWASPHRRVRRLTEAGTERFLAGERKAAQVKEEHHAALGGGLVVLTRATYERVPLDSRFVGWGGEDLAWGNALHTLAGKAERGRGTLWHCWHPPQPNRTRTRGSPANDQLRRRYRDALNKPDRMTALIEEATCPSNVSSPAPQSSSR